MFILCLILIYLETKNTNIFFELLNLPNYFVDNLGRLYHFDSEMGFRPKKAVFQGSTIGYRLNHRFVSLKILKSMPKSKQVEYKLPF